MSVHNSQVHSPGLQPTHLHTQWPHLPHCLPPSPVSTHHSEPRSPLSIEVDPGGREERPSAPPGLPFYYSNISLQIPNITVTEHKSPGLSVFNAQPDSGNAPAAAAAGGESEHVRGELLGTRNTAVDLRILTGRNRQTYIEQRRFTMENLAEFVKSAGSFLSRIPVDPSILEDYYSLEERHKRLVESTAHLESRENSLRKDESQLNMLEDKLLQMENACYGPTPYNASPISHSVSFVEEHIADSAPRSPNSVSEDEPELVRQYYETLRDANSFRDDLVNFSGDYQRAKNKRTARRERGETVTPSEFEFVKKYSRKRKTRLQKFELAREDVLRLREECIEKGFTVEDLDIPPFDKELCPDPLSEIPEPIIRYASSLDHIAGNRNRSDDLLVKDPDTKGRVATWVDQVAHGHPVVSRKHHSDSDILAHNFTDCQGM